VTARLLAQATTWEFTDGVTLPIVAWPHADA
jgi:hypothetical protein